MVSVPARTPMFDENGNLARTWISFFETLGPTMSTVANAFAFITDYGADSTGVNDSSPAIIKAFAALKGGTLYFPEGTYLFDNATITTFTGLSGRIWFAPGAKVLFTVSANGGWLVSAGHDILFEGVTLGYQTINPARVAGDPEMIRFDDCQRVSLRDYRAINSVSFGCRFFNCDVVSVAGYEARDTWADGLHVNNSRDVVISGVRTRNTGDTGMSFVDYGKDAKSARITASNIEVFGSGSAGIDLVNCNDVTINGLIVDGTDTASIRVGNDGTLVQFTTGSPQFVVYPVSGTTNIKVSGALLKNAGYRPIPFTVVAGSSTITFPMPLPAAAKVIPVSVAPTSVVRFRLPYGADTSTTRLPAPLVAGTIYYPIGTPTTTTCQVSATFGGAAITFSDAGAGEYYLERAYPDATVEAGILVISQNAISYGAVFNGSTTISTVDGSLVPVVHNLTVGEQVHFLGNIPVALDVTVTYFVKTTASTSITVSLTPGGAAVAIAAPAGSVPTYVSPTNLAPIEAKFTDVDIVRAKWGGFSSEIPDAVLTATITLDGVTVRDSNDDVSAAGYIANCAALTMVNCRASNLKAPGLVLKNCGLVRMADFTLEQVANDASWAGIAGNLLNCGDVLINGLRMIDTRATPTTLSLSSSLTGLGTAANVTVEVPNAVSQVASTHTALAPDAMNWGLRLFIDVAIPAVVGPATSSPLLLNLGNSDNQRVVAAEDFYLQKPVNYRNGQVFCLSVFQTGAGFDIDYASTDKFWVFPAGFALGPASGCLNFLTFLIDSTLDTGYGRAILQTASLNLFI